MKFSVIVPVYNVAPFLRECLDSLLTQSFADWEAICVDDGSTDGSGVILDEYAVRDSRIRVIHQENHGVCVARQIGLDAANGEYVTWIDPDDLVLPDYFKAVDEHICKNQDADLIGLNYLTDYRKRQIEVKQRFSADSSQNLKALLSGALHGSTWNKLFRRDFILKHSISYDHRRILVCEDLLFVFSFMLHCPRVTWIDRSYYYYRVSLGSISHSIHRDNYYQSVQDVGEALVSAAVGLGLDSELKAWMAVYRYEAYSNENVSNRFFAQFFPEVAHIDNMRVPFVHKFLFRISAKSMVGRTVSLRIIAAIRFLKKCVRPNNGN